MDSAGNTKNRHKLLVWDAEGLPPVGNWTTVLWSSFGKFNDPSAISIPLLVEEQADALRLCYLAWVYELGETLIKGKRVVDHLELRPGFSYWWMTSLAQRFNVSGTSQIDNAIKCLAFERLVSEKTPSSILLVSRNLNIVPVLAVFCRNLGLPFKWKHANQEGLQKLSISRQIYGILPSPLRAVIYFLWHLFGCSVFHRTKKESATVANGEITFVDILVHLDVKAFASGSFISNYWTALVDKLLYSNVKTNWLHNYFSQKTIPTLDQAYELTKRFTKHSKQLQDHILIESNMTLSVFLKALKDYFKISSVGLKISEISRHFKSSGSEIDFWPLFKQEWIDSVRGQSAMVNCLRFCLYEKTFSALPYQRIGVYIQENQPWEMALIYSWKAAGHGKLIGAPHATVRFWDLRYFYDSRSYERTGKNILPIPDLVAVNGPVAKKVYLEGGYPEPQVTEVEALRFFHTLKQPTENRPIKSSLKALKVLVCGDFLSDTNFKILSWLSIAVQYLPPETTYVLKPHPAYSIKLSDFPSLVLELTDFPLDELFADCDVVFTSTITSAAVDAYCAGIPVVQMLDGQTLNVSPLRNLKDVVYVTNPVELADALYNARYRKGMVSEPYFHLNEDLPRWQKLLELKTPQEPCYEKIR